MVIDILSKGYNGPPECEIIAYDISDIQEAEKARVEYLDDVEVPVSEYDNIRVVQYKE